VSAPLPHAAWPLAVLIALTCGLGPHVAPLSASAGDSLLEPSTLRLPGEAGHAGTDIALPRFLQPLTAADTASDAIAVGPKQEWIGDSWMRNVNRTNGFGNVRVKTDAERNFATVDRWRRGFALLSVVLLACAAIASIAVLMTLAQRR
jgi:hypothetical protein